MRCEKIIDNALFSLDGNEYSKVQLPHTWNALDGQDGGDNYRRGHGFYKISLPNPKPNKHYFIQFEGANHKATVSCNGKELGSHLGGFSTFRFELTNNLKESDNELFVDVCNEECDIYPQTADFTFYGGLYRNVTLIETEDVHFDLLKDGTNGVFITPFVTGKTRLDVFPINANDCKISVKILDKNLELVNDEIFDAIEHTAINIDVKNPELWDGRKKATLYTAKVAIIKDDTILDEISIKYGYRSFHVDPNKGFFLNGRSYPLHGVSRHQDRLNKGWAISNEDHEEDLKLIEEVGANTIRLAHYQHAQHFYDICDESGMVLWAEIPFISVFRPGQDAKENTLSQMKELIAQNYNHPSIFFWGISNEITIGGESEELYQNLCEVNALAKKMDTTRLTTMAQVSMLPIDSQQTSITDVQSYNHYFGWYGGEVSENGPWLDEFHKTFPDRAIGLSEYGCEAILKWHSENPVNHDYTEEYQAYYHHEMLKTFEKRPYIWATHVWNMFDFAADARDEGGCQGRNNKGLITYDRKTKKDSFYLYKVYWSNDPTIHICGSRFRDRAPGQRDITVYTNLPAVTLYLNGHRISKKKAVDHMCVFKNVKLKNGENTILARAKGAKDDQITLCGVSEKNSDYILPMGSGLAGNWFDADGNEHKLEFPEGYCSIHDRLGDLLEHPEAGPVLKEMITSMAEKMGMGKSVAGMMRMVRSMQLDAIIKMAGNKLPDGMAFQLNEMLTKFKK